MIESIIKNQEYKKKYHGALINSSLIPIQNEVLTINSEHQYYEYEFERKLKYKISPSNKRFEQPEEELNLFKKYLEIFHNEIKSTNANISDMIARLYDTFKNDQDNKIT